MTLAKEGKANFTQNHCDRYRDHCNGISQGVKNEFGLNTEYSMGEWEFMARGQGEDGILKETVRS